MTEAGPAHVDFIYVVHGSNVHTWWKRLANGGYPWWKPWSLFCDALRIAFGRECVIRDHSWSGRNDHQARIDGGIGLANRIEAECGDARVHIVGHSHGGNVALVAANRLPVSRVDSIVILANPNIAVVNQSGALLWPYWGEATLHVQQIWNLSSPEDWVQTTGARLFHGMTSMRPRALRVERTYEGPQKERVNNASVSWKRVLSSHRAMHSSAMGTLTGSLLTGMPFEAAMSAAGLDHSKDNEADDRGGFGGVRWAGERIRQRTNPSAFDLGHTNRAVGLLIVHGFTASPSEMRPLANFVHERTGSRCRALLLPGHGTRVEDLERTGSEEWVQAVCKAYDELAKDCSKVFAVGLSLGATLCCHLALRQREPESESKLQGLILLAPAFGVSVRRALGLRILKVFMRRRSKGPRAAHYFLDRGLFSYVELPLGCAVEVLRLGRQAWENLDRLKDVPTLMLSGDLDRNISLAHIYSAARRNPWIDFVRLPRSRHILTVEPDSTQAFEAVVDFINKHAECS